MDRKLFEHYATATREALAAGVECPVEAFTSGELTIVDRPGQTPFPYTASVTTFGTGTVLSIDAAHREFAEANAPPKHYDALSPRFLQALVEEGARRGATLEYYPPAICFTLSSEPPDVGVPDGCELRRLDAH